MEKIMENPPTSGVSVEWAIGGVAAAGVLVAGFLWGSIKAVRREAMSAVEKIKSSFQRENTEAGKRAMEVERRFALKGDVDALRSHMDERYDSLSVNLNQRFDQLTSLIIQQRGK